jgi:hypothetical protein
MACRRTTFLSFPPVIYDLGCRREIAMLESSSQRQEQRLRAENEWLEKDFQARMTRMQVCNCYITLCNCYITLCDCYITLCNCYITLCDCYITLICVCRGYGTVTLEIESEEQISPQSCEITVSLETAAQLYQAT